MTAIRQYHFFVPAKAGDPCRRRESLRAAHGSTPILRAIRPSLERWVPAFAGTTGLGI